MEESQTLSDPSRPESDVGWIVFGPICFTGLGVLIAEHPAGR